MATEARTQLAEQQRTRAEPKPEKKSGCGLRSHEDSRPQKELMIPGIVDLELIREARRPSKPQTPGAYRFGRLSHHSFFSRHHPHPQHVTHIQDLTGKPVCVVRDEPSLAASPQATLSSRYLIEAWKKELKDLASRVAIFTKENEMKNKESLWPLFSQQKEEPQREQGAKYSAETGRLIPASTRATARRHSRQGVRNAPASRDGGDQTFILQDQELLILELLSQVLQTDSLNAIQFWLLYAPPKANPRRRRRHHLYQKAKNQRTSGKHKFFRCTPARTQKRRRQSQRQRAEEFAPLCPPWSRKAPAFKDSAPTSSTATPVFLSHGAY
ncbi:protein TBATA isoform X5 [Hippopotamus amphibius kiboko]|uniref:protein TBATA isoform X5 n=1 Tax=Hippopotamus amphibius kiboko TaxID=575201 RepID=UPI002593FD1B|nr:protein TBATA isoform X5 [Hippopotamus amphibius kiboko]